MDKPAIISAIVDDVRRIFQVVNEQSKKAEHATGITGPQLWAIKVIGDLAPIRISDLARRMYLHPATVVGIVDRLEKRGLVKRRRSKEDRRVVKVELTQNSREIIVNSPQVAQGLLIAGLEELSEKKLATISNSLEELVNILRAQELPPRLMLSSELNLPKAGKKQSQPQPSSSRTKNKD